MDKNVLFFTFIILMATFQGFTQNKWSLDACIAFAQENNLINKGNTYVTSIKKESFQQSKRDFLPTVSGSIGYNLGFGRYIDPNTNDIINTKSYSNSYSLGTSLMLFNGFRQWNHISQKRLLYEASLEFLLDAKYELAFQVMDAFYLVKFNEGLFQVSKERQELTSINYKMISAKVKLGLKAKSDLYEIESNLAVDELRITQAQNQLEESVLNLMQIMNLVGPPIKLQSESNLFIQINENPMMDIDSTFNKSNEFLPEIKMEKLNLSVAEKGLSITKSNLYPQISLGFGLGTGFYQTKFDLNGNTIPFFDQILDNVSKSIGIYMSVPIFNKWSVRSSIKIAKIGILERTNNLEQKRQNVYKEIQKVFQKNEALLAEKQGNELSLKAKELAFTIAQKKFTNGILSIYELQQSKNNLTLAKIEKIRIGLQLRYQEKTIDYYNGIPVFQFN